MDNTIAEFDGRPCANLLLFFRRVRDIYEAAVKNCFENYWGNLVIKGGSGFLSVAASQIEAALTNSSPDSNKLLGPVDTTHKWDEMTIADMRIFDACLKYSLRTHYLLVHYSDNIMWHNSALGGEDVWNAYGGLFRECRSAVIDLYTMEYAALPFGKFFNLGEENECSSEAVKNRIARTPGELVQFANKLDGSFIQLKYVGNDELYNGYLISSSGSLWPEISPQIRDVEQYLSSPNNHAILCVAHRNPELTFICEWIDKRDPHIVQYKDSDMGLHLIGVRNIKTGFLWPYSAVIEFAHAQNVPTTDCQYMTLGAAIDSLKQYKGCEKEGYVLYIDEYLVKVKGRDYLGIVKNVELSKSFNTLLVRYLNNTADDFVSGLPAPYKENARQILRKIARFEEFVLGAIEREYAQLSLNDTRKNIMLAVNKIQDLKYGVIREGVRAKALGRPVSFLCTPNNDSTKYIKESVIDEYLARR